MERTQRTLGAFGVQEEKGNEVGHVQGNETRRTEPRREVLISAATGSRAPGSLGTEGRHADRGN